MLGLGAVYKAQFACEFSYLFLAFHELERNLDDQLLT